MRGFDLHVLAVEPFQPAREQICCTEYEPGRLILRLKLEIRGSELLEVNVSRERLVQWRGVVETGPPHDVEIVCARAVHARISEHRHLLVHVRPLQRKAEGGEVCP